MLLVLPLKCRDLVKFTRTFVPLLTIFPYLIYKWLYTTGESWKGPACHGELHFRLVETTDEEDGPLLSPLRQIQVDLASPEATSLSPPSPFPFSGSLARVVVPASWAGRFRISERRLRISKEERGGKRSRSRRLEHAKVFAAAAAGPLDRATSSLPVGRPALRTPARFSACHSGVEGIRRDWLRGVRGGRRWHLLSALHVNSSGTHRSFPHDI